MMEVGVPVTVAAMQCKQSYHTARVQHDPIYPYTRTAIIRRRRSRCARRRFQAPTLSLFWSLSLVSLTYKGSVVSLIRSPFYPLKGFQKGSMRLAHI